MFGYRYLCLVTPDWDDTLVNGSSTAQRHVIITMPPGSFGRKEHL